MDKTRLSRSTSIFDRARYTRAGGASKRVTPAGLAVASAEMRQAARPSMNTVVSQLLKLRIKVWRVLRGNAAKYLSRLVKKAANETTRCTHVSCDVLFAS